MKKINYYQISMEGSGMKLVVGAWELRAQLEALCEGNEELEYKVKPYRGKIPTQEFEGF